MEMRREDMDFPRRIMFLMEMVSENFDASQLTLLEKKFYEEYKVLSAEDRDKEIERLHQQYNKAGLAKV